MWIKTIKINELTKSTKYSIKVIHNVHYYPSKMHSFCCLKTATYSHNTELNKNIQQCALIRSLIIHKFKLQHASGINSKLCTKYSTFPVSNHNHKEC